MPDVLSIGLGGGSLLCFPAGSQLDSQSTVPAAAGSTWPLNGSAVGNAGLPVATDQPAVGCSVGPDSVGAALEQHSLCFGGPTATASDAAVLLGRMQLGSQPAAAVGLSREQAQAAWQGMQRMLGGALDRVKTEAGERWMAGSRWKEVSACVWTCHAAAGGVWALALWHRRKRAQALWQPMQAHVDDVHLLTQSSRIAPLPPTLPHHPQATSQ